MLNFKKLLPLILCFALLGCCGNAESKTKTIVIKAGEAHQDMTYAIRTSLEEAKGFDNVKIVLEDATYFLKPDMALEMYTPITNHGNGSKRIAFLLQDFESVEIEGNGAELIFHSQMMPFLVERCNNVTIKDLTVDWDIPFTFLGEVVATNSKENYRDIKPRGKEDGFSWKLVNGRIQFPNIDGFNYSELGSTLAFTADTKRPVVGALDLHSNPTRVEKLPNGNLRIYEKLRQMPPVGSLLSSKGDRKQDRYAPAFDVRECSNVVIDNATVHHALGMAFLFERSDGISLRNSTVGLREGSKRVISSTADASHFANCKGDILIENCKFENMLDDGTNVHGTYVEVTEVVDSKTVRVKFKHFEQLGFKFADKGDDMWFILQPSPQRAFEGKVKSVKMLNEEITEIAFEEAMPSALQAGDLLENKTWNPTFTMRNCFIGNHRARSIVLKTPLKTVIEGNHFSSMMSGVLFRGETKFWYESGAVQDVLIKDNVFENSGDCGTTHAALYITPVMGANFSSEELYDKNIRFVGNTIRNANPRVVIADRVDSLIVTDNKIERTDTYEESFPDAPVYEIINSKNVTIKNNSYSGEKPTELVRTDANSSVVSD